MSLLFDISFENFDQLRETLLQLKSNEKKISVNIDISAEHSMTRNVDIASHLSDVEIMQFLQSRAMDLFGHTADQLCIDYEIQPSSSEKQTIAVIAARAEFIKQIEKLALNKKIKIKTISVGKKMNLLPWRDYQRKEKNKKIILISLLFIILILFCCITLKCFLIHRTQIINLKTEKISAENTNIILHHSHQHFALLQKLNSMHLQKIQSIDKNKNVMGVLSDIANDLPSTVTLTSLEINNKQIKIVGISNQLSDIHQYADNLKQTLPKMKIQLSEINQLHFTIQILTRSEGSGSASDHADA